MPRQATDLDPWTLSPSDVTARLESTADGLSSEEAEERLRRFGANELREERALSRARTLTNQLRSPLLLLLVFAAAVSVATSEWTDATIVLAIVLVTVVIGFRREYAAETAAAALRARVKTRCTVLRDGRTASIPVSEVVPGDVVLLAAGALVPADGVVLDATDCYVSEAALTGESFPVVKRPGALPASTPLAKRRNSVFLGTNVRSGTARMLVVKTGLSTQYGAIAHKLSLRPPETEFDRGVRHFGYLLSVAMLVMVLLVLVAHLLQGRPLVETLLFSIALAVGLSPELLPAILGVNLSRGAEAMAQRGVLVRRLNAIENLGSMDVLCTDKTGTLTAGVIEIGGAFGPSGVESAEVLELAATNAALQTGLPSPIDDAILKRHAPDLSQSRKRGEIPFDFVRRRLSVIVEDRTGRTLLITKGAFRPVLSACVSLPDGAPLDAPRREDLERRHRDWSSEGIRVVAVACREVDERPTYSRDDEANLTFLGFLTLADRPKEGVSETLAALRGLGVSVKIITGDNRLVAGHVAELVGLRRARILGGDELDELHGEALWTAAEHTDIFAEVDPNQKERIIAALKRTGHVVGFLGDGVNDAPAMHVADTSLSVDQAVDVAREAADFVLLDRDLDVIRRGIEEGRKTFANTLKYVLTTTSANLGNMVSMAVASMFLPFLPLLAGQILLNNFLSDIPAVGIASDSVDPELIGQPKRWSMRFIGTFMVAFGLLSSLFDFLTFGVLLYAFDATPSTFRTGWFIESLLTELVIALVVRTRRSVFQSRPGKVLFWSTQIVIFLTFAIPYLPHVGVLGFTPLPWTLVAALIAITFVYVAGAELLKRRFYKTRLSQL